MGVSMRINVASLSNTGTYVTNKSATYRAGVARINQIGEMITTQIWQGPDAMSFKVSLIAYSLESKNIADMLDEVGSAISAIAAEYANAQKSIKEKAGR